MPISVAKFQIANLKSQICHAERSRSTKLDMLSALLNDSVGQAVEAPNPKFHVSYLTSGVFCSFLFFHPITEKIPNFKSQISNLTSFFLLLSSFFDSMADQKPHILRLTSQISNLKSQTPNLKSNV